MMWVCAHYNLLNEKKLDIQLYAVLFQLFSRKKYRCVWGKMF